MFIIGYEYESLLGIKLKKAIVCKSVEEYRWVKKRLEDGGANIIEFNFDEVYEAESMIARFCRE